MKQFLKGIALSAIIIICTTVFAGAQQKVFPAQCTYVVMAGDFNNGTGDTSQKTWAAASTTGITGTGTFPVFYCAYDTVILAAGVQDSVHARLIGEYNSVTINVFDSLKAGTSCDSVTVKIWATATYGNGQGSYVLLQSSALNFTSVSEQPVSYIVNSTGSDGNPYTNYRVTWDVDDRVGGCVVKTRAYMLVR